MSYLKSLGLAREPFSNSPDPDFFYRSCGHVACLQRLELAIRLKRGLNVVLGDVGTGKSTICRELIRRLATDDTVSAHLVLDPAVESPHEFLRIVSGMITGAEPGPEVSEWRLKESLKSALFDLTVRQGKLVVLLIDEGQKLSPDCLELTRELLNYETNSQKLLQVVILAQSEFMERLKAQPNLLDRINDRIELTPLDFTDTREMIRFRLNLAKSLPVAPDLFSRGAYRAIYRISRGYPRKIMHLSHKVLVALIVKKRKKAGASMVRSLASEILVEDGAPSPRRLSLALAGAVLALAAVLLLPALRGLLDLDAPSRMLVGNATADAESAAPAVEPAPEPRPRTEAQTPEPRPRTEAQTAEPRARTVAAEEIESTPPLAEASKPGKSIGSVTMARGQFLSRVIADVYGVFRNYYLARVIEANPELAVLDDIPGGTAIEFPPLVFKLPEELVRGYRVQVAEYSDLARAYAAFREVPDPRVRLLPWYAPEVGFHVALIMHMGMGYATESGAESARATLPPDLFTEAVILKGFPPGAVFYSSVGEPLDDIPYVGNARIEEMMASRAHKVVPAAKAAPAVKKEAAQKTTVKAKASEKTDKALPEGGLPEEFVSQGGFL